jgi:uncharacterized protein YcbK (DUF882 family)
MGGGAFMRLSQNFTEEEFACPHCGLVGMTSAFIQALQVARTEAGIPFRINSGYRCKEHNVAVGGKPNSSHLRGMAADIAVRNNQERFIILNSLFAVGFKRIGIGGTYIHVDTDSSKARKVAWYY